MNCLMPTINKIPKKPKSTQHRETDIRLLRQKVYNNTKWRKVRELHLKSQPLCQECLRKGKVTPADQVHHINGFIEHGAINWAMAYDDANLESICAECHGLLHQQEKGYSTPEQIIAALDELLLNDNWDED